MLRKAVERCPNSPASSPCFMDASDFSIGNFNLTDMGKIAVDWSKLPSSIWRNIFRYATKDTLAKSIAISHEMFKNVASFLYYSPFYPTAYKSSNYADEQKHPKPKRLS